VARLMRAAGLQGCHRPRLRGLTRRDPQAAPAPDLVERNFAAPGPDRLWVADITQQRTDQGWLYVAVVLDCFSRRIIGWSMAEHLRTELVLDALDMAIAQRQPGAGLVHHRDHGCQYTSLSFGHRLGAAGLVASMAPSATRWTMRWPRASSPPWSVNYSTATTGQAAKPCGLRCSTSSRSSTTASVATPPWTPSHPSTTSTSLHHQHPPHSQHVHRSGGNSRSRSPAAPPAGQLSQEDPPSGTPQLFLDTNATVGQDRVHPALERGGHPDQRGPVAQQATLVADGLGGDPGLGQQLGPQQLGLGCGHRPGRL
jgi:hypothetical protein